MDRRNFKRHVHKTSRSISFHQICRGPPQPNSNSNSILDQRRHPNTSRTRKELLFKTVRHPSLNHPGSPHSRQQNKIRQRRQVRYFGLVQPLHIFQRRQRRLQTGNTPPNSQNNQMQQLRPIFNTLRQMATSCSKMQTT
jgi:hypothetical protein